MASILVVSLWLASLFVTTGLGWLAGRRMQCRVKPQSIAPAKEQAIAGPTHSHGAIVAKRARADCKQPFRKSTRAHILDDMPPVETVRAEADAIRAAANLWDAPGILASLRDGSQSLGKVPEKDPEQSRKLGEQKRALPKTGFPHTARIHLS